MKSIENIFNALKERTKLHDFCELKEELRESFANDFIDSFAKDNQLEAHTISPLRWRFDSKVHGEIADGVIEFDTEACEFKCVNVSDLKLTELGVDVDILPDAVKD